MSEDLTRFAVGTEERDIVGAVSALLIAGGIVLPKPRIRLRDILAAIDARDRELARLRERVGELEGALAHSRTAIVILSRLPTHERAMEYARRLRAGETVNPNKLAQMIEESADAYRYAHGSFVRDEVAAHRAALKREEER